MSSFNCLQTLRCAQVMLYSEAGGGGLAVHASRGGGW